MLFRSKVEEVWSRGKLPILVGGSGFYLLSLFYPPTEVDSDSSYNSSSWEELYKLDPERAGEIKKTDYYRISRAVSIARAGKKPSSLKPKFNPFCNARIVVLYRDRKELYERINERTLVMLQEGWIDEVKVLSEDWKRFLLDKKLIGYEIGRAHV